MRAFATLSIAVSGMAVGSTALAAPVPVSDVSGLLDAINSAVPGDEIILADGTYAIGQNVNCTAAGTPAEPIVVRAENPLGAIVEFDALEGFKVDAPHWHFEQLDIRGVCASDPSCEHAFHVVGAADGFVLRDSRVADFNAQLKVNAQNVGGTFVAPNDGVIERCDIGDTDGRQTSSPVTKLNIDGGVGWIVRDTYIHDFHKDGGNGISYGAFMKSGGQQGLFERNLVLCDAGASNGGTRIGLSFGGGGTAAQFCAPAYDANVPCDPEHTDGTMRNNIIAACNDVGIYLNRATNTQLLYNTLIDTAGIDYRFMSSTGFADGNVLGGTIDDRDGASHTEGVNLVNVDTATFNSWYTDPLAGDLSIGTAPVELVGMGGPGVADDYCARARPSDNLTLGALEHSLGSCDTFPPPGPAPGSGGNGMGGAGNGGGPTNGGGASATGGQGNGTGGAGTGAASSAASGSDSDDGCGCRVVGDGERAPTTPAAFAFAMLALSTLRRRVRRTKN